MTIAEETRQEDNQTKSADHSTTPEVENSNASSKTGRLSNFLSRFRQEKETWLVIEGYLAQDLKTDEPVYIKNESTLLGNVFAPKILIEGTLSGSAYAREIDVQKGGEIRGDVYTMSLNIAPGATVQGWVSSINEDNWARLQATGSMIDEAKLTELMDSLNENVDNNYLTRNEAQLESLHLLQMEMAVTLAARSEIEQDFERRLTEMAGEAYNQINALSDQLTAVHTDLTSQKNLLDEAQETMRQQKNQIDRQRNELTIARDLLKDQNQELGELRERHQELQQHYELLKEENAKLEESLSSITKEKEQLDNRVESLETAHRSNLQYQAEQKDSLIRWQELAEVTEKKAAELETKLQQYEFQFEENTKTIDLLSSQRKAIEKELEKALDELATLQGTQPRPSSGADSMVKLSEKIKQLEASLANAEQEYQEQTIWYKASLETSRLELEKAREGSDELARQVKKMKIKLNQLQEEAQNARDEAENWKNEAAKKGETWQSQIKKLTHNIEHLKSDKKNMQATLRESQIQLEASEAEVKRYLQETKAQGERLADIHAQLVERDLQLKKAVNQIKQAKAMIEKQNQTLIQIKQVTTEKIHALQAENAKLRKLL